MARELSELYRRGVVRPLDEAARDSLRRLEVFEPIRCEWLPILDDDEFALIWESGLLQAITEACDECFGDYELTVIEGDEVARAAAAVRAFLQRPDVTCRAFAEALYGLLDDAHLMRAYFVL